MENIYKVFCPYSKAFLLVEGLVLIFLCVRLEFGPIALTLTSERIMLSVEPPVALSPPIPGHSESIASLQYRFRCFPSSSKV